MDATTAICLHLVTDTNSARRYLITQGHAWFRSCMLYFLTCNRDTSWASAASAATTLALAAAGTAVDGIAEVTPPAAATAGADTGVADAAVSAAMRGGAFHVPEATFTARFDDLACLRSSACCLAISRNLRNRTSDARDTALQTSCGKTATGTAHSSR